jgi:hypothetical protein
MELANIKYPRKIENCIGKTVHLWFTNVESLFWEITAPSEIFKKIIQINTLV